MAKYIPWTVRVGLNFEGRQGGGSGGSSSAVPTGNLYLFSSANPDFLELSPAYSGTFDVAVAGTAVTGLHPDIIAGLTSAWVDTTDYANPAWNFSTITASNLAYVVDATFNGIVANYTKNGTTYYIDMGAS